MISSVQSSYIPMCPKMADKAHPSQELPVTMRAGRYCRIVWWKRVAFSTLLQFTSPFGLADSLLLIEGSATGDDAAPPRAILGDALPALRVNVKALNGGLQGVLEVLLLAALGTLSCQKFII